MKVQLSFDISTDYFAGKTRITFKQWADLPPAGDSSLAGVLTERRLQKEDGDPTSKQEDEVRNEEGTWTHMPNKYAQN